MAFLLLRIPTLKIRSAARKEVFEANLKAECDLWHLMVKEMWAGKVLADDHKVRSGGGQAVGGRVSPGGRWALSLSSRVGMRSGRDTAKRPVCQRPVGGRSLPTSPSGDAQGVGWGWPGRAGGCRGTCLWPTYRWRVWADTPIPSRVSLMRLFLPLHYLRATWVALLCHIPEPRDSGEMEDGGVACVVPMADETGKPSQNGQSLSRASHGEEHPRRRQLPPWCRQCRVQALTGTGGGAVIGEGCPRPGRGSGHGVECASPFGVQRGM